MSVTWSDWRGRLGSGSHSEYGHSHQAQDVSEHQLLVDTEVEPGVLGQQGGGGRGGGQGGVTLRGQNQGKDTDHGCQARDVVRRLPRTI